MRQPTIKYEHGKEIIVFVNVGGSPKGDNQRWRYFTVKKALFGQPISQGYAKVYRLQVDLLDKNSNVIRQSEISMRY